MDIFFITYDEPQKDQAWEKLQEQLPSAKRVDGIKGFNRAYQECAKLSETERFFTIDGDNSLTEDLKNISIEEPLLQSSSILSWSAKNSINGLIYGNGGVKNWPRNVVLEMKSHEDAESEMDATDFCFRYNYYQMPGALSVSEIHHSPYQAFRAGFREGLKMSLDRGLKITPWDPAKIHRSNWERLRIWCTIGRDHPQGLWAIYGARLGCYKANIENLNLELISDYQWFKNFWEKEVFSQLSKGKDPLEEATATLGDSLNKQLGLELSHYSADQSAFFKSVYQNRPRFGPMYGD